MSRHDFSEEDAAAFDPDFMNHPHTPQDIEAAEANRVRIAARVRVLHAHGHNHPVQTKRGPGRLDRVGRDGTAYVWFGRIMPDVYWSRTLEQLNQQASVAWHKLCEQFSAGQVSAIPPLVFHECRVPRADIELVDDGMTGPCGRCKLLVAEHPVEDGCKAFEPQPKFTRKSNPGEDIVLIPSNGTRIGSGDVSLGQTGIDELHVDDVEIDEEKCAEMEKAVREREAWIAEKKAMKKKG